EPHEDGSRTVFFELNGQPREVSVVDHSLEPEGAKRLTADPNNRNHVGAGMPGMVVTLAARPGDSVEKGQKLIVLEAMKMQTAIVADRDGKIAEVFVKAGSQIQAGDLLMTYEG
ncbi:MAG: biotin/lipoyl-binding protein, partial [Planctomycetales bacterium]|nr:biotin/lipoyl-binding protein [Planctomycetales bacterium]